jgi:hypothetical protein
MNDVIARPAIGTAIILLVVGCVAFVVGALVSVLRSRLPGGMKLVWCVLVVVAPFLGSLLWFAIGRKYAR